MIPKLIAALIAIETGGHPTPESAVGDGGKAVGCLQMWPTAVAEANRIEAINAKKERRIARVWKLSDRLSRVRSIEMATVILDFHWRRGCTDIVKLGGKWRNPYSTCPDWYLQKLRKQLAG